MIHNLALYSRLLGIQLRSQMQFRLPFFADLFSTALLNFSFFAAIVLVLERFGDVAGWTLPELAFLYGMIESSFGTMDMVFSTFDPDTFGAFIRTGRFDQVLLRPMNLVVQIMGHNFILRRLGRISQGLAVLIYALVSLPIAWTAPKLILLPIVWLSQVIAMGALYIVGSTLTIWTVERLEAINIVTYGGVEMMGYPFTIFPSWLRTVFTWLLPFIFLNYLPALYILDKSDWLGFPLWSAFVAPLAAGMMFFLALRFFRFGLRHYQGTGS